MKNITIQEASEKLNAAKIRGTSEWTIYKLIREKELRTNGKSGRNTMLDASSVEEYILRATRLPVADDGYIAFYVRVSAHRDPRGKERSEAIRKLLAWAKEIAEQQGIHLCYSPNQTANNVRVFHDCMGNNHELSDLPGFQRLCVAMSRQTPKLRYLFVYSLDRLTKGDHALMLNLCRAFNVEFFCKDILGKREAEILKDDEGRILLAKAQREVAARRDGGINRTKAEKNRHFAPLIHAARAKVKTADKGTLDRIRGLLMAYTAGDRNEGLYKALEEALGA